ncbi:Rgp1-domain-containing protein [Lipomyces arxii]|uniref:Rgp1-domain-containing protein n=1 Tax=Lipomyces arxii TaxID=56418 RepID=UPI0034CFB9CE
MSGQLAQSFLRVEVAFRDPVYFAGEELECRITFRNIAPTELHRAISSSRLRKSSVASIPETGPSTDRPPLTSRSSSQHSQHSQHSIHNSPQLSRRNSSLSIPPGTPTQAPSGGGDSSPQLLQTSINNGLPSPTLPSVSSRRSSLRVPKTRSGETLMMGYAQLSGSFTLDESLVNTSVFDNAKKQGIVGGKMGGGVVGLGTGKNDGGYLWSLGFGLSNGLNNLLNGNEISSIAEMKSMASSNSISIISTPQSLLFVDLRLYPGESKSYSYKMMLPRMLPPSYRGKALKISYSLSIGTQRIGKGMQQPKVTKFPFRVFQNIDSGGNQPVHSLTSPIIKLRDEAVTKPLDENDKGFKSSRPSSNEEKNGKNRQESLDDFLNYVNTLLTLKHDNDVRSDSPVSSEKSNAPSSCRESVDLAVQRSSMSADGLAVNNVFEIARNKQKIATLTLSKPVYKLGETIVMVVDFSNSILPCYHITASLETTEVIDPEISLRSPAFNERATRKVYAQSAFSTLVAKRASFSFCIPTTATAQFDTSYIFSRWSVKLEFVTTPIEPVKPSIAMIGDFFAEAEEDDSEVRSEPYRQRQDSPTKPMIPSAAVSTVTQELKNARSMAPSSRPSMSSPPPRVENPDLFVCTHQDERGSMYSFVDSISCETFDCRIPIRVFPTNQDLAAMSFQIQPTGGYVI